MFEITLVQPSHSKSETLSDEIFIHCGQLFMSVFSFFGMFSPFAPESGYIQVR